MTCLLLSAPPPWAGLRIFSRAGLLPGWQAPSSNCPPHAHLVPPSPGPEPPAAGREPGDLRAYRTLSRAALARFVWYFAAPGLILMAEAACRSDRSR